MVDETQDLCEQKIFCVCSFTVNPSPQQSLSGSTSCCCCVLCSLSAFSSDRHHSLHHSCPPPKTTTTTGRAAPRPRNRAIGARRGGAALKRTKWNQQHVSSTNIFELNVGGQTFATSRETLTSHRSAYLERLCGGANHDDDANGDEAVLIGAQRDAQGRFFIDRDPDLFRQILEYLRGSLDAEALSRQERKSCEPKRCTTS